MLCDCGAKMFVVENVTLKDKNIRKLKCKKCGCSFVSVEHRCSNQEAAAKILNRLKYLKYKARDEE